MQRINATMLHFSLLVKTRNYATDATSQTSSVNFPVVAFHICNDQLVVAYGRCINATTSSVCNDRMIVAYFFATILFQVVDRRKIASVHLVVQSTTCAPPILMCNWSQLRTITSNYHLSCVVDLSTTWWPIQVLTRSNLQAWFRQNGTILYECANQCTRVFTEHTWFGKLSSCCSTILLPGPAWVLLNCVSHTIMGLLVRSWVVISLVKAKLGSIG